MKKFLAGFSAVLAFVIIMQVQIFAAKLGFLQDGGYSPTDKEYTLLVDETKMIYNKILEDDPNFARIYSGSKLYIPIGVFESAQKGDRIATLKEIKDDNVAVSHKATKGEDFIESVSVIDGKKFKDSKLPAGAYVEIAIKTDNYNLKKNRVNLHFVLSVNKISYQKTGVVLAMDVRNPVTTITKNTVYGAFTPTIFRVSDDFKGNATFDFGDNIKYTATVTPGAVYYLNADTEPVEWMNKTYKGAHLQFLRFKGDRDTFAASGRISVKLDPDDFKDKNDKMNVYVYRILDDKLQSMDTSVLRYKHDTDTLEIRTKTLSEYVISDTALMKEIESDTDGVIRSGYADPKAAQAASEAENSKANSRRRR